MKISVLLMTILALSTPSPTLAFDQASLGLGLGYFLEENLGKETTKPTGEASTQGPSTYPILIRYEGKTFRDFYFAPTIAYTVLARKSAGDSAETTNLNLIVPIGENFGSSSFDWYVGPGVLWRQTKGAGGTTTLNNGTSTATFAIPGQTINTRNYTINLGSSYRSGVHRGAFDILAEAPLSSKRSFDFMLSYIYRVWGGGLF